MPERVESNQYHHAIIGEDGGGNNPLLKSAAERMQAKLNEVVNSL